MEITTFTDADAFAEAAHAVIERRPAESNILATVLDTALDGHPVPDSLWLLITDGETPVAAAMQTPPNNLFLTPLPDERRGEATQLLAERMLATGRPVNGITALNDDAHAFTQHWCARTGHSSRLMMAERLYEIDEPPALPNVPGRARPLTEADVPLVSGWLESYNLEVLPEREAVPGEQVIRRRLFRGWFLVWIDPDGDPVALAGLSRPVAGVGRIGPVYTPPFRRRQGYGAAITAAAVQLGFDQGADRCALYADLANPTSNGVYRRLGFRPLSDTLMVAFQPN